jgi:hypothetical protein
MSYFSGRILANSQVVSLPPERTCQGQIQKRVGLTMLSSSVAPARRRITRIPSSDLWVYWEGSPYHDISRVRDLSPAGLFVETRFRVATGAKLRMHFLVQEGQIRLDAQVCHTRQGQGHGLKIQSVLPKDIPQFDALLARMRAAP